MTDNTVDNSGTETTASSAQQKVSDMATASQEALFAEEVVASVNADFAKRQASRRPYELAWQQNMNFVMGNQYCYISGRGDIAQEDRYYFWQERQVYNHIAPIVETRLARLADLHPRPVVRPYSSSDEDIYNASLVTKILDSTRQHLLLDECVSRASMWSEICGTVFYKLSWDSTMHDGMGDVAVTVCPPFEIYPDSNVCQSIADCQSIIHARVYSTADVASIWGVDITGQEVQVFAFDGTTGSGGLGYNSTVPSITREHRGDSCIVIERYTRANSSYPEGLLEIVAGDTLLYRGVLPYVTDNNGKGLPFVRQVAFDQAGCFWGGSVVERCVPIQRAYNAVKNRKHEYLNRLSMGILTVEDGSIDTDNLEEEGLSPGKVLVYRQGANKPAMMDNGSIPMDFSSEEDRLLQEFSTVSGVSEFAANSVVPSNVTSGFALQQLTQQDDTRLALATRSVKDSVKGIATLILRLYRQLATSDRLSRVCDDDGSVEIFYYNNSHIANCDVVLDTDSIQTDSVINRRAMVMQLLTTGLLTDDNGNMDSTTKSKVLQMIGFGNWEQAQDTATMHMRRADGENIAIDSAVVLPIDDHECHIEQHSRYVISGSADKAGEGYMHKVLAHIEAHQHAMQGHDRTVAVDSDSTHIAIDTVVDDAVAVDSAEQSIADELADSAPADADITAELQADSEK